MRSIHGSQIDERILTRETLVCLLAWSLVVD